MEQLEDRSLLATVAAPALDITIEAVNSDQNSFNNGGQLVAPPDTNGAVGPNHVVNVTNNTIEWYSKTGTVQYSSSLSNFFRPLQPVNSGILTDPKVLFDSYANRFVVVYLEVLDVGFGSSIDASRMMLAVSDDADPNGNWHYQSVNTTQTIGGGGQWMDYPGFGLDEEAIYVTGTMFPFTDSTATIPGGSRLWILNKGNGSGGLYDGGLSNANIYNPAGNFSTSTATILQPAFMYGPGQTFGNNGNAVGTWLAAYDGNSNGGNERVTVIRVDNPLTTPVFTPFTVDVGNIDDTLNTAFPAAAPTLGQFPVPLPGAPQAGSTSLIDWNDRRMNQVVWRNNQLYAVTQILPPTGPDANQVTVHWFRIDTSNPNQPSLGDQGNIGGEDVGSNVYTSYPSVAVDPAGNMAIAFAATSPGMDPGFYYTVRAATDAAGTMRKANAIALGEDAYVFSTTTRNNRWGDYTGIGLDPTDSVTFWAYGQYAKADDSANQIPRYGTRWGAFHLGALPNTPGTNKPPAFVSGTKWNDLDRDGVRDTNEVGVAGFTMYVDVNGNNLIDLGEPAARTDSLGNYTIESNVFGTYGIREVPLAGWEQIFPGQSLGFEHTITLVSGQTVSGVNFGNNGTLYDFGDAPTPYPVTLANDGARAAFKAGFHLGPPTVNVVAGQVTGVEADTEADGQRDANAQGDDLNGTDDEDGVVFPAAGLVAGGTATLQITVSTGNLPAGALQGWIDWNGDGDWNDTGEQIIKDRTTPQGTENITINVPATAKSGTTYARFRYGYEKNIGVTGASIAGEVEDYQVQVISDEPVAVDDAANITQNSASNIVSVLANDFASSAGGLRIQSVGSPNRGGTAVVDNRGTANTADDVVLYTPVNGFVGTETFSYTITDNSGKTDTAVATMTVVSLTTNPIAVDDSFSFAQAAAATLNVLANDVVGNKPPITIQSVSQPAAGQGTVTITSGGTLLQYSPPSNQFVGDVQFTYTIADVNTPTPRTSTTTVTLHVGDTTADDDVAVRLQAFDLSGNPITVINPGQEFDMVAFVQDLRTDDTVGNPTDKLGVYSAYFDLLFNNSLVSLSGPVVFNGTSNGGPWGSGQTAGTTTPGLLDESGAFQGSTQLLTSDEVELYRVRMRANATGQANFAADPADVVPLHDILVFEPPSAVPLENIRYGTTSLFIGDPASVLFKAVDDTISVPNNSGNVFVGSTTMAVMDNDLKGLNTPVVITSVTPIGAFQGSLARSNSNTTVTYTAPSGGFVGVQQFKYTLQNALGVTSEATVTMKIGSPTTLDSNDQVQIRLVATDAQGNPITSINTGSNFQIRAFVSDLRSDDGDGNPNTDNRGAYAAYLDVLYSYQFASFVSIDYNTVDYNNGKKGDGQIPGLVDEVGAFQTSSSALGAGEVRLFTLNLKATNAGTFKYQGDPHDVTPLNDVLLYSPPAAVGVDLVRLNGGSLTINSGSGGEFTNPNNPYDVNGDGFVTPLDVLLIVNDVNANGSRPLAGGGSGEAGGTRIYPDVNRDKYVSPIDALLIINVLNGPNGEGEGDTLGEVAGGVAGELADLAAVDTAVDTLVPSGSKVGGPSNVASPVSTNSSNSLVYVVPTASGSSSALSDDQSGKSEIDSLLEGLSDELASDVASGWNQI